jgi:hypothetical protein
MSEPEEKPRHKSLHDSLLGLLKRKIDNLEIYLFFGKIRINNSPEDKQE